MTSLATKKTTYQSSIRRRINVLLYRWHRRIGVMASVFLVWMAISGWLLNHTGGFNLAQQQLTDDFITTHYGIRNEIPTRALFAAKHWLVAGGDVTVLDGEKIAAAISQPLGMVINDNSLFIASTTQLVLLDINGELIDKVSTPITIEKIGLGCSGVVIANANKQLVTHDGVSFADCSLPVQWAQQEPLSAAQRAKLVPLLQSKVSLERVLLDLHSGRFFGAWGVYFVDVLGFGLVALALSGVWLFVRHGNRRRTQPHSSHR